MNNEKDFIKEEEIDYNDFDTDDDFLGFKKDLKISKFKRTLISI